MDAGDEIDGNAHYECSTLRENILEHLLVGELLRTLWRWGVTDAEVLRSEFDAGGYDLVVSRGCLTRHIQLKSVLVGGKNNRVKIGHKLATRASGCVVWLVVTEDLEFVEFRYFGGKVGQALPSLQTYPLAKHTKGNSEGVKLMRPQHRIVPRSSFEPVGSMAELIGKLLGISPGSIAEVREPVRLEELLDSVTSESIHQEL